MSDKPLAYYNHLADVYAAAVDSKPLHVYYERPNTWSLLPKNLKGLEVLDMGCASGWYSEQLIKAGCHVTAVDASPTMVEITRKRLQGQANVIQANLEKPMDFAKSQSFDIVLASLMIHYLDDWPQLMKEVSRILKPGGLFIFSTHQPQSTFFHFKLDNYFRQQIITDFWPDINMSVQYYHRPLHDLTEALSQAGFLIEKMIEPLPKDGLKENPKLYELITTQPWFLFVVACHRKN